MQYWPAYKTLKAYIHIVSGVECLSTIQVQSLLLFELE